MVLLSADGVGTMAIQRQTGKGKPTIWRWQARFMAEGVDGLLHEATRPAGKPPLTAETIERVVEMTLADLSVDEFPAWERDIERHCIHGPRTTRYQIYCDTEMGRDRARHGDTGPALVHP